MGVRAWEVWVSGLKTAQEPKNPVVMVYQDNADIVAKDLCMVFFVLIMIISPKCCHS